MKTATPKGAFAIVENQGEVWKATGLVTSGTDVHLVSVTADTQAQALAALDRKLSAELAELQKAGGF